MIKIQNPLGTIEVSHSFFVSLVSHAIKDCYGVAEMSESGKVETVQSLLFHRTTEEKGVKIINTDNGLRVELHIIVIYGVNIPAIVKSIINKVKYSIEDITGFRVAKVCVCVDGMLPE